jgi:hypothetical protein
MPRLVRSTLAAAMGVSVWPLVTPAQIGSNEMGCAAFVRPLAMMIERVIAERAPRHNLSCLDAAGLDNPPFPHGIESTERFGYGTDPDGDGFTDQMTRADVTAVSVFQATRAASGRAAPRSHCTRRERLWPSRVAFQWLPASEQNAAIEFLKSSGCAHPAHELWRRTKKGVINKACTTGNYVYDID